MGWLTRKAIGLASVTLHIKEYEKDGVTHIDIQQTATGGVKGTTEERHLDWVTGEHTDHVFGKVRGQSRWTKVADLPDEFLKTNWLPESLEGEVIESSVESVGGGWTANQIWGFQENGGKRMYARNVTVTKGSETKTGRLFYDYVGPYSK